MLSKLSQNNLNEYNSNYSHISERPILLSIPLIIFTVSILHGFPIYLYVFVCVGVINVSLSFYFKNQLMMFPVLDFVRYLNQPWAFHVK